MEEMGERDFEVDLAVAIEIELQETVRAVEAQMVPGPGVGDCLRGEPEMGVIHSFEAGEIDAVAFGMNVTAAALIEVRDDVMQGTRLAGDKIPEDEVIAGALAGHPVLAEAA